MGDGFKYREIHCNDCSATLTKYSEYVEDDVELCILWNTRANDAPKQPVDKARDTINALRAYYGAGKTTMTDEQIQAGMEHYRPKRKCDFVIVDELTAEFKQLAEEVEKNEHSGYDDN